MKKTTDPEKILQKTKIYARLTLIMLIASAIAAYLCSLWAYAHPYQNYPSTGVNDGLQMLGVVLIFVEIVLAFTLKNLHGGLYWFSWLQLNKTKSTPQEQRLRERVFERSYGYAVALAILGVVTAASISRYDSVARQDLLGKLIWILSIMLVALPSIVATHRMGTPEK